MLFYKTAKIKFIHFAFICLCSFTSMKVPSFCENLSLDFEIAFDQCNFSFGESFSVSPNEQHVAYTVTKKPHDISLTSLLHNGTPLYSIGSRIFITHLENHDTLEVGQGDCWRPAWSPNGQKLAFYSNVKGIPQLWVYDISSGQSHQINDLPIKATISNIDTPIWSADSKTIYIPLNLTKKENAFLENSNAKEEQVQLLSNKHFDKESHLDTQTDGNILAMHTLYQSTLAAINVETRVVQIIVSPDSNPSPGFLKNSPSRHWLLYTSVPHEDSLGYVNYDLAVVKSNGQGTILPIAKGIKVNNFYTGYAWHPYEDKIAFIQDDKLYLAELDNNGIKSIKQICQNVHLEFVMHLLRFTEDGKKIIIGVKPFHHNYRVLPKNLVIITLDSDAITELPISERWQYRDLLEANQNHLIALLSDPNTNESVIMQLDLQEKHPSEKILWKGLATMTDFQKIKDGFLCFYEDLNHSPNIYKLSANFTQLERISHIDLRLDKLKPPIKVILETTVPFYNGELKKVHTTILLPEGAERDDHLPALVFIYPGADQSESCRVFMGQDALTIPNFLFLNQGYALIFPDVKIGPTGTSGYPLQEIADVLLPQVYNAAHLGYVDIHRLGIAGQSYGAYGTAGVIARTNLFRAAVAVSGTYDLASKYGDPGEGNTFSHMDRLEHGQGRMGHHPWNNWMRYFNNSPYCLADKIQTPLLIIHGEKDDTCNVYEARKMFTALKRLDRQVQLAVYTNQGHAISEWNRSSAIDASKRILDFFDRHLNFKNQNF